MCSLLDAYIHVHAREYTHVGINPGRVRGRDLQIVGWGRGVSTKYYYILQCTPLGPPSGMPSLPLLP